MCAPRAARRRLWSSSRRFVALAATFSLGAAISLAASAQPTAASTPHVLRVGTWKGIAGQYATIASAVDAAQPGDWILVGPGDYHEQMDHAAGGEQDGGGAAVELNKADLHLRGMDRNQVVVDGTKPGAPKCSSSPADQDLGPLDSSSKPSGRNGVEAREVDRVTIDNLTACNFLTGDAGGGNGIWWNGGDGTGQVHMADYSGSYLSATTTYYEAGHPEGEYGIFVSNASGPGVIAHTYGSNMADAGYYIGACPDCNMVLDDAHAEGNALGYSGTNSGGRLTIQNSEFDDNKTGLSTNSQNNDDAPSPQDGVCPAGVTGPTGSDACWILKDSSIHDNNNANVPGSGTAELGPPGTGVVISGGRRDIVKGNTFTNNGSWALLVVPYIDTGTPPPIAHCNGGIDNWMGTGWCFYATWGNQLLDNTFSHNGSFANPTNGDLGDISDPQPTLPGNCWNGNTDAGGLTEWPANLQATNGTCGQVNQGGEPVDIGNATNPDSLTGQVICASELFGPCDPSFGSYPRSTDVTLLPLATQASMPDPCAGVPVNPWCPSGGGSSSTPGAPPAQAVSTGPKLTG
jgi:hypothetical protein